MQLFGYESDEVCDEDNEAYHEASKEDDQSTKSPETHASRRAGPKPVINSETSATTDQLVGVPSSVAPGQETLELQHSGLTALSDTPILVDGHSAANANTSTTTASTTPLPYPGLRRPDSQEYESLQGAIWRALAARQNQVVVTRGHIKNDVEPDASEALRTYYQRRAANAAALGKGSQGIAGYITDTLCRYKNEVSYFHPTFVPELTQGKGLITRQNKLTDEGMAEAERRGLVIQGGSVATD